MSLDKAALDRYLTREPYWMEEAEPIRCVCGAFLPEQADEQCEYTNVRHCNGKAQVINDCTHDDAVLRIIGEEHRHDTFQIAYAPECGGNKPDHHFQGRDGEIDPKKADEWTHEPHFFEEPYQPSLTILYRTCKKCGHLNKEPQL